ncbi:MAG: hypothetical protein JWM09_934, partial [Francisellaceae bacterium]|nr:hypothetical protein [Francisellaceae bacterium]
KAKSLLETLKKIDAVVDEQIKLYTDRRTSNLKNKT